MSVCSRERRVRNFTRYRLTSCQSYIFDNQNAMRGKLEGWLECLEQDRGIIAPMGRELIFSLYLGGRLIEPGKSFNGSLRESSFALYLVSGSPMWTTVKRGFRGDSSGRGNHSENERDRSWTEYPRLQCQTQTCSHLELRTTRELYNQVLLFSTNETNLKYVK